MTLKADQKTNKEMRLSPKPPNSKRTSTKCPSTWLGSQVIYKEQDSPLYTAHQYRPWASGVELRVYGPRATIGGKGKSEKFLLNVAQTVLKLLLRPPRDIRSVVGRKKVGAGGKWKRQKVVERGRTQGGAQRVLSSGWATVRSTTLPPQGRRLYPMAAAHTPCPPSSCMAGAVGTSPGFPGSERWFSSQLCHHPREDPEQVPGPL